MVRENGSICGEPATEVDHIKAGDDHSDVNLQAICHDCHKRKSSSEGGVAAATRRRATNSRFRRREEHPGLIR